MTSIFSFIFLVFSYLLACTVGIILLIVYTLMLGILFESVIKRITNIVRYLIKFLSFPEVIVATVIS